MAALSRHHQSSAQLGGFVGLSTGPVRFELGYDYAGFPGYQGSPYRLLLHQATASAGYQFVRRPTWGFEVQAGGGYGIAQRDFGDGLEEGSFGLGTIGLSFIQTAGKSRLSLGLLHSLLIEMTGGSTTRLSVGQVLAIQAGVSYVF